MAGYDPTALSLLVNPLAGQVAPKIWGYSSVDAVATVAGAGYFTDGANKGLAINDIIFVADTVTPLVSTVRVKTINATTGAVTTSAGTTVGAT